MTFPVTLDGSSVPVTVFPKRATPIAVARASLESSSGEELQKKYGLFPLPQRASPCVSREGGI